MRYSIITATIVRPTLKRLCDSIDAQTNIDWEHIVMVDVPLVTNPDKAAMLSQLGKSRRKIVRCGKQHKDFGNTCKWNAWAKATGDYILYIDDDDYYADDRVLETLNQVTAAWAIFPCLYFGVPYLANPPQVNSTGSNMFMHRRDVGRHPCFEHCEAHQTTIEYLKTNHSHKDPFYAADGMLVEQLKAKYPYQVITSRPLTVCEQANKGQ